MYCWYTYIYLHTVYICPIVYLVNSTRVKIVYHNISTKVLYDKLRFNRYHNRTYIV